MSDDPEEELDVEGVDEDCPSSLSLGIDPDEPPSTGSHLPPELSQHPWLMFNDQFSANIPDVVLHDDIDESSRLAITQMIQEEHTYFQKHKFIRHQTKAPKTATNAKKEEKPASYNTRWTEDEKKLFKKGIEMFGHKWKEIADLIQTRNHTQVKTYSRSFLLSQPGSNGRQQPKSAPSLGRKKPTSQVQPTTGMVETAAQETQLPAEWVHQSAERAQPAPQVAGRIEQQVPGGVQQASGGVQRASAGVQQACGGVQLASGGVQRACGGVQQTSAGVKQACGGVRQACGGVQQASAGVQHAGQGMEHNAAVRDKGGGCRGEGDGCVHGNAQDADVVSEKKKEVKEEVKVEEELEEEEDVEIDVEDDSVDESIDPGCLQAAQLFGDILRNRGCETPPTENSSASAAAGPSVATVMPGVHALLSSTVTADGEGTSVARGSSGELVRGGTTSAHSTPSDRGLTDVGGGKLEGKTLGMKMIPGTIRDSSADEGDDDDDDTLTICLPAEKTLSMKRRREKKSPRKKHSGKRKRAVRDDGIANFGDEMTHKVVSTEATPESELPGNSDHYCADSESRSVNSTKHSSHVQEFCEHDASLQSRSGSSKATVVSLTKQVETESLLCNDESDSRESMTCLRNKSIDCQSKGTYSPQREIGRRKRTSVAQVPVEDEGICKEQSVHQDVVLGEMKALRDPPSALAQLMQESRDACLHSGSHPELEASHGERESSSMESDFQDETGDKHQRDNALDNASELPWQQNKKDDHKDDERDEESIADEATESSEDERDDADTDDTSQEDDIDAPKAETTLDAGHVTEEEKAAHPEFFDFKSYSRTPARYLAIRNHIIKCWQQSRPAYLNKTTVRSGLRNAGDVNAIGSIHSYLESIGAINFGASNPFQWRMKRRRSTIEKWAQNEESRTVSTRPRRQTKQPQADPEGAASAARPAEDRKTKRRRLKPPAYDPFKLVECSTFSPKLPAPFLVRVKGDVIVTVDLHAHLSTTEVIGLLGGRFDGAESILDVRLARPCKSLSTGMQCEMDPVSQTEACEELVGAGLSVVGWYHSHPTFSPNPSIRDIETQQNFQEWFSQDAKTPFVGVIVSPYHSRQSALSKINYLTISKEWSQGLSTWKPYKFDVSIYQERAVEQSHQQIVDLAMKLISEFSLYKYRVEMLWVCPGQSGITYLEKMLQSVSSNLCGNEGEKEETLARIRRLVFDLFDIKCSSILRDSPLHVPLSFDSSP